MSNQAEANLAALIESTEDLIWSVDLDYRLITFNRALRENIKETLGVQLAAGMCLHELLPPERAALWPPFYERVLHEGPFRIEYSLILPRTLELAFNPIVVDGHVTGISVFGKDITERKAAEKALQEAEKKYRDIFEGAVEGFYQSTPEGKPLAANPALAKMLGYDWPDELKSTIKDTSRDVWMDPEERARYLQQLEEHGVIQDFECQFKRKDGTPIWVSLNTRRVCGSDGRALYLEGFIEDITGRKRAERQIRESEERYRTVFQTSPDGVIISRQSDGVILDVNQLFLDSVGFERNEVIGRTVVQLGLWVNDSDKQMYFEQLNQQGEYRDLEVQSRKKNGELFWIRLSASLIEIGGERCRITFAKEISEVKAAQARMAAAQEALRASEERYRTVFQTSLDAISINRVSDEKYIDCNQAFLDNLGFEREEVLGRTSQELNIWADERDLQKLVEILRQNYSCRGLEARFRKKNGVVGWGEISAEVIELDGVYCIISITRDTSDAKAAEERLASAQEALRASEERYRTVFQTSPDLVDINRLDDGTFIDANDAYLDILGFEREEVIGRTSWELNIWADPRDRQSFVELLRQNSNCRNLEANLRRKNGEIFSALISAAVIELDGVPCIVSITRDMSAAKEAENTIRNLAFYDPLTGLPNRRLLLDRLRQALAASARWGRTQALLLIDLDNLKTLNETLGHQTGDHVLREFARRLAACVRETDTVARLGGDEFVVMLEDLSEVPEEAAAQAQAVSEKILASVDQPYLFDDRECLSSASIGIAVFGDRQNSTDDILQQTDIALHQAKAAGRNTMRFFSPALQAAVNARATLEEDLRKAIKTNQFLLYYQPQVEQGRLTGAEALIRWKHPLRGIVPPDEFIPLAEETGLILPLGEWVLQNACTQIAAWAGQEQTADFTVAVNISARQLRQPEFVGQVLAALDRTGANPQRLRLELTESMLVENIEEIIAKMTQLKSHGLRFSLDDFGTGYSSLAYLKRLPLDRLKVDRAFVRDILVDASSGAIAQTILSLGRAMGLSVIAEGVETEEQLTFLAGLGCHSFQGYLFSRPLPVKEFHAFLQSFKADAAPPRQ
jgi:diguanylate cyclase (GGDEF)-like protein/PAS domain S-box-containing protein